MKKNLLMILLCGIMILGLTTGCGKQDEKVAEQYCDILIKENYEDLIDIAYFPNDKILISKKEEAKEQLAKKMKNEKKTITSCEPMKSKEDDKKIYYKLTINESDSTNIEIDKSTNKVYIDGLYEERTIDTNLSSKVSVNGIELSNPTIKDNDATYKFNAFSKVDYDYTIKNDILEDINITWEDKYYLHDYKNSSFKEEFKKSIDKEIKTMFKDIADVEFNDKDENTIEKYFINNDYKNIKDKFKKVTQWSYIKSTYKELTDEPISFDMVGYINDNEIQINVGISYKVVKTCVARVCFGMENGDIETTNDSIIFTIKNDNGTWKILNWE